MQILLSLLTYLASRNISSPSRGKKFPVHANHECSSRFTPMLSINKLLFICVIITGIESRIHKRFSERHGLSRLMTDRTVPNPSDTSPKLDQVEQSVNSWPPARMVNDLTIAGVSTTGFVNASATASWTNTSTDPEASIGTVTDLEQALKEIKGQSNSGIAQLSGSTASLSMALDLLRANIGKFQTDVRFNFTRIDRILNDLGDSSTIDDIQTIKKNIFQLQSQLGSVAASAGISGIVQGLSQRISDLGSALNGLSQRVTALDGSNSNGATVAQTAMAAEAVPSDTTLSVVASIPFVLQSWSGRIAIVGAVTGIVALVLSIISLTRLPKSEAAPTEAGAEEQVLMEAGEGEQVDATQEGGEEYYEGQEEQAVQ
jgi:hypothetical protein